MSSHLLVKSFTPVGGTAQEVGTITVLVGPNNSGKSAALCDLARLTGNFEPTGEEGTEGDERRTTVIQDVALVGKLSLERVMQGITMVEGTEGDGKVAQGLGPNLRSPYRRPVAADLKNILFRPILTARSVSQTSLGSLMPLRVAYLPAEGRTGLVEPATVTGPLRAPEHLLTALHYADPQIHERFERAMFHLFDGMRVRLDATERIQLCLRTTTGEIPQLTGDAIHDALAFGALRRLGREGEGVRNCAAIVLAMLVCQGRVILIDRPEAGLQPATSQRLGTWIAENAAGLGCQVFVATSDPAFLSGLYGGGADVLIWRLARRGETTRFDAVPAEVGKALATFPLFSSQQATQCLFHDGVVVTPHGMDAVVYQAVADRLLRGHNVGFLQAYGTRNLAFVTKALRRANLPVCAVADLDLFQSESLFTELVKSLSNNPPPAPWLATRDRLVGHVEGWFDEKTLSETSSEVESFLDQFKQGSAQSEPASLARTVSHHSQWERLRTERLAALPPELRIWVEELIEDLKRIGLFVSPRGRLQGWIAFTSDAEDPDGWLNRAMQVLNAGDCPAELRAFVAEMTAYVKASQGVARTATAGQQT